MFVPSSSPPPPTTYYCYYYYFFYYYFYFCFFIFFRRPSLQEFTPAYLEPLGFSLFAQRLVWGFLAGLFAGALTVPVDNVSTVVMTEVEGAKDVVLSELVA